MGFSRQAYWSGLPLPSPGDLPDPGIAPGSLALQADSLPTEPWGKPHRWLTGSCCIQHKEPSSMVCADWRATSRVPQSANSHCCAEETSTHCKAIILPYFFLQKWQRTHRHHWVLLPTVSSIRRVWEPCWLGYLWPSIASSVPLLPLERSWWFAARTSEKSDKSERPRTKSGWACLLLCFQVLSLPRNNLFYCVRYLAVLPPGYVQALGTEMLTMTHLCDLLDSTTSLWESSTYVYLSGSP